MLEGANSNGASRDGTAATAHGMSAAGRAAAARAARRREHDASALRAARAAGLRAANEDDDGYDPYADYMDARCACQDEQPSADPWR